MGDAVQRHHADGPALCRYVRDVLGQRRVLLAFSMGKDSLCAWWQLREHGIEVVPFHRYLVPGLRFVEDSLARYERVLGTRIIRIPHPSLYRWLENLVFQPPERWPALRAAGLKEPRQAAADDSVRRMGGAEWIATGVRSADSPVRYLATKRYGSLNPTDRTFMPVFDWRSADVERCLEAWQAEGVGLPVDYLVWGRTFDGLDARFLGPMREHLPEDYTRTLEWFPLADLDLYRREMP